MNESPTITEEDIRKLPRWPRAAFAMRCARRGRALFHEAFPDAPPDYLREFDQALSLGEMSCAQAKALPGLDKAADWAKNTARSFRATTPESDSRAAFVCADCADTLGLALGCVQITALPNADVEASKQLAYTSYQMIGAAATKAGLPDRVSVLRKDYDLLRQAAEVGKLTDESPVWPQFYGLKKEAETYYRELPKLVAEGKEGQFVLIEGDRVVKLFPTWEEAAQAGREQFAFGVPFLVKQVEANEKPVFLKY
ncbi:hypothetical protein AYO44_11900 [Planctomycetaceae bacterium SCGC AG-212-F19]|nr:hypothetical protein AYO44_11900 [Planctomycetaceae bacterium SCGC AG-212-F19]